MTEIARAARSQVLKLRPLRWVGLGLFALVAALAAGLTVVTAGRDLGPAAPPASGATLDEITSASGLATALAGAADLVGVVALALAAWAVGQEWSNRTLPGLLVRLPRRIPLLAGLIGAVTVGIAAAVLLTSPAGVVGAVVAAGAEGIGTSAWWSGEGIADAALALLRMAGVAALWSVIGACLAVLLRSPVAAIGVGLAYALPGEALLSAAWSGFADWLPGRLLGGIAGADADMGTGIAFAVVLLQVGALAAVAVTAFVRRLDAA